MIRAEDMRQSFLEFRQRLYGLHDLTAVDAYIHPEFRSHNALIQDIGRAAYKAFVQMLLKGLPDLQPVSQHVLVEGQTLMSMTEWVGTHSGTFLGAPATGATLKFATADRYQLRDGLLFEHWDVVDRLDASIAIGLIRPVAAADVGAG